MLNTLGWWLMTWWGVCSPWGSSSPAPLPDPVMDLFPSPSIEPVFTEDIWCHQSAEPVLTEMSHILFKESWCSHVLSFVVCTGLNYHQKTFFQFVLSLNMPEINCLKSDSLNQPQLLCPVKPDFLPPADWPSAGWPWHLCLFSAVVTDIYHRDHLCHYYYWFFLLHFF